MPAIAIDSESVLIEKVKSLIATKLPEQQAHLVSDFASYFYRSISQDDINVRSAGDLYGSLLSLWHFMQGYSRGETQIRIFNPTLEEHGWHSNRTVIEILVEDMPFLVDSLLIQLNDEYITTHLFMHVPLTIERDESQQIITLKKPNDLQINDLETPMYLEIDRIDEVERIEGLRIKLESVIEDVRTVVQDWRPMQGQLQQVIKEIQSQTLPVSQNKVDEALAFLNWISNDHFTFMGYRKYEIEAVAGDHRRQPLSETAIGLKKKYSKEGTLLSEMPVAVKNIILNNEELLIINKSNILSRIHRPAHIDYVGVKRFDEEGRVIGEHAFIGLYTSAAYNASPFQFPLLREKIRSVLEMSGLTPKSHDYKTLINILETYPRDQLIQIETDNLLNIAMGILHLQERQIIKVFVRRDTYGRYFSVLLFVPREMHNTKLRIRVTDIISKHLQATGKVEFTTRFSESILARIHFIVPVNVHEEIEFDLKALELEIIMAARSWADNLEQGLFSEFGENQGRSLFRKYQHAFPGGYQEDITVTTAVLDIKHMESLSESRPLSMILYRPQEELDNVIRFKLFLQDQPAPLSEVLPLLENMGLKVLGETPYHVTPAHDKSRWILDFSMLADSTESFNLNEVKQIFQEAFESVWNGNSDSDLFNHLVLKAKLSWREINVLRAYSRYMWQIGLTFSRRSIADALSSYPQIARQLMNLFSHRFCFEQECDQREYLALLEQIEEELEQVTNLNVDRILRHYVELIRATLRTNYYQVDEAGAPKSYISFKIDPSAIADMPMPRPMFEIFVFSPRVEGVHLRYGRVARGGLRWSDRLDDYRTEILGLVKAQQVKNSVIVPVGAKGGFVMKTPTKGMTREQWRAEGEACYQLFIQGLLDITDNYVSDTIVPPKQVLRHDDDDPYLVVAADKGTATFSDIANRIAESYHFWLGDAFASGGSAGYDHKKMGITARGAWESVKRHFREIGIDCQTTDFTCFAVGDMAGDVFGNGMLLSKHIRLIAAFNHMHIFIDPNPDSAKSYLERKRLFDLSGSTWLDYDAALISKGGGVFSRSAKAIVLSAEMQQLFNTKRKSMPPNELIRNILKLKVDLFWNGGIGTYIKAHSETDADVGDRANDAVRINGSELQSKIVGEGGNLGLTQLGRIEYMLKGGRANTDFIDNAGGVDCSDHEVNIKILLNEIVADGDMTVKQRNELLSKMTDEVAEMVLRSNYRQIQSLSITETRSKQMVKEHARFINELEKAGKLDRALEFLPSEEELNERIAQNKGLTRAELAVLTAYGKMELKEAFNTPKITQDPCFHHVLTHYFPEPLREHYADKMAKHRLLSEIIAMQLANDIVNYMGANIVYRLNDETGAEAQDVAIAFTVAKEVFEMENLWCQIESLDNQVDANLQLSMMLQSQRMVRRATRWFLRRGLSSETVTEAIAHFKPKVEVLKKVLVDALDPKESEALAADAATYISHGVPKSIAEEVAQLSTLFSALDIIEVSAELDAPSDYVAEIYFKLGLRLELHWFLDQINLQPVENHWQAFARGSFREELDWQQRQLTLAVVQLTRTSDNTEEAIEFWMKANAHLIKRWSQMLADFKASVTHEFAKFSVALRELLIIVQTCLRNCQQPNNLKSEELKKQEPVTLKSTTKETQQSVQ